MNEFNQTRQWKSMTSVPQNLGGHVSNKVNPSSVTFHVIAPLHFASTDRRSANITSEKSLIAITAYYSISSLARCWPV